MVTNDEHEQAREGRSEAADEQAPEDPIAQLERERDEMKAIAQRAQADLVNYKRRAEEERWALARSASNGVVSKLLPIVDITRSLSTTFKSVMGVTGRFSWNGCQLAPSSNEMNMPNSVPA